jgi:ferredoxin
MSGAFDRRPFDRPGTATPTTSWHDAGRPAAPSAHAATGSGQRLVVDRIRCDGFGMCAELLPEIIELDDWGYPIVAAGAVPDDLLEHARRAVAVCPVLALRLAPVPRATMPATPVPAPMGARRGG